MSREGSKSTFPASVEVRHADLKSVDSLTRAFAGQDAVVVASPGSAVHGGQTEVADAAVAAGVKRFLPSEFGHNTRKVGDLLPILGKMLAGKKAIVDHLIELAKKNPGFTWTGVGTSLFLDWVRAD